jgi:hypothetical protein
MSDIVHILESVQMTTHRDEMMCGAIITWEDVDSSTFTQSQYCNQWHAARAPEEVTCQECSDIFALELLGSVV